MLFYFLLRFRTHFLHELMALLHIHFLYDCLLYALSFFGKNRCHLLLFWQFLWQLRFQELGGLDIPLAVLQFIELYQIFGNDNRRLGRLLLPMSLRRRYSINLKSRRCLEMLRHHHVILLMVVFGRFDLLFCRTALRLLFEIRMAMAFPRQNNCRDRQVLLAEAKALGHGKLRVDLGQGGSCLILKHLHDTLWWWRLCLDLDITIELSFSSCCPCLSQLLLLLLWLVYVPINRDCSSLATTQFRHRPRHQFWIYHSTFEGLLGQSYCSWRARENAPTTIGRILDE